MKKMKILTINLVVVSLSVFAVFAGQKSVEKDSIAKDPPSAGVNVLEKQILLFVNPNGRPCQMQLSIIDKMKEKLAPLASLTYIKTTDPQDREKFHQYGIRGLPMIIIADKNGKEINRFSPGIQDENAILAALNSK